MNAAEPIRRIVTGYTLEGVSVVRSDDQLHPAPLESGDAAFQLVWTTPTVPAQLNDDADGPIPAGLTLKGGSVIRVVDMAPGRASPLHRSYSIDYGIVLSGDLELELDGGDIVRLGPGDIVVQRGTNHLWRNPSPDKICRIVFILIEADPITAGGRTLPEIHP